MMTLSVLLHVAAFVGFLIIPESMPSRRTNNIVYEVNLVEMPSFEIKQEKKATTATKKNNGKTVATKNIQAIRIDTNQETKKPLVISKRTTKKKSAQAKKPEISSSQLIDQAISRIEKTVESEEKISKIDEAISRLEEEVKNEGALPSPGEGSPRGNPSGAFMRIYQMEVETKIKGNWSYPMALRNQQDMEAVVEMRVKRDGTVMNFKFIRPSSDSLFDNSIIKAIEKSKPLPPFPESYRKSYDEFEIRFHTEEL